MKIVLLKNDDFRTVDEKLKCEGSATVGLRDYYSYANCNINANCF